MHSNLGRVSLLGRRKATGTAGSATNGTATPPDETTVDATDATEAGTARRTTAPKGRPTPKRDSARRRGPVAPAPMTAAEARRRRKEMRGAKLSRAERRAEKQDRRAAVSDRRERMMAGEEAYLQPRDQGPVRRYVRDVVDSRRTLLGLFMPAALGLIVIMLAAPLQVQPYMSPAMMVLVAIMAIDGFFLARKVNGLVDEKFSNHAEGRWKLGWYAATRASQLRRMRTPRPAVQPGERVE